MSPDVASRRRFNETSRAAHRTSRHHRQIELRRPAGAPAARSLPPRRLRRADSRDTRHRQRAPVHPGANSHLAGGRGAPSEQTYPARRFHQSRAARPGGATPGPTASNRAADRDHERPEPPRRSAWAPGVTGPPDPGSTSSRRESTDHASSSGRSSTSLDELIRGTVALRYRGDSWITRRRALRSRFCTLTCSSSSRLQST